ncbi:MAG TPA: MFS transporter [Acidimicrobiales bacterium]|nr:MFS transporter [Acidimicrobiales bacterium]
MARFKDVVTAHLGNVARHADHFFFRLGPQTGSTAAFTQLARAQALSSCGDAVIAVALAGSVFFDVSTNAARSRVALSLVLTVAPFAVVGPLLGPRLEGARGGRRAVAVASGLGRAACCLLMALWTTSLALFPVTFCALVFSKLFLVTKASLVPVAVPEPERLVTANSKLTMGASAAGMLAGGLGAGVMQLFSAPTALRLDASVYALCAWQCRRLSGGRTHEVDAVTVPARRTAPGLPQQPYLPLGAPARPSAGQPWAAGARLDAPPRAEGLPPGGVELAAIATGALRFCAGFATFLLVFTFRRGDAAWVWYGLALGGSQVGNVAGVYLAPRLRRVAREEWMVIAAAGLMGAVCLSAGIVQIGHHWLVAVFLATGIGVAAGSGKTAFDSLVQRDLPAHVRSRAFARFESAFQLAWAVGGLLAVLVAPTLAEGFTAIGVAGLVGAAAFNTGARRARRGALPGWFPGSAPRPGAIATRPSPASSARQHSEGTPSEDSPTGAQGR